MLPMLARSSLDSNPPASPYPYPGALLIGIILSSFFPDDGIKLKIWVVLICLFDFVTAVLHSVMVYIYFVNHQDEPFFIAFNIWAWDGLTKLAVHLSVCSRALTNFILTQTDFLLTVSADCGKSYTLTMDASISPSVSYSIEYRTECSGSVHRSFYYSSRLCRIIAPMFDSTMGVETTLDILITASLIHIVHQHRNEFAPRCLLGDRERKNPFMQLMVFFLTRGCVITCFQVILVVVMHIYGITYIWAPLVFCTSQVYAISAIMTLNNRRKPRDIDNPPDDERPSEFHITLPTFQMTSDDLQLSRTDSYVGEYTQATSPSSGSSPMSAKPPIRIRVDEEAISNT
ncbi:hypothetical protein FA95DRAFT_1573145 [Auriscalpium vulgare]|uniref:Uncharacterized protein n=1 Tax=Auriscalpium vulgare TaxID=40419 RepID=A0ACB8RSI1_9AGAM|nr:hypothetical protein FA95DRAFT_1573145 [Auriscalpium vulgare]